MMKEKYPCPNPPSVRTLEARLRETYRLIVVCTVEGNNKTGKSSKLLGITCNYLEEVPERQPS